MRVGFIGLSAMGMSVARNLHRTGLLAGVWSRTREGMGTLTQEGASVRLSVPHRSRRRLMRL